MNLKRLFISFLLLQLALPGLIRAESASLAPGQAFPFFSAQDQHEQSVELKPGLKWILVSFDMGTGKRANRYLEKLGADFLPEHDAVFIANIYGMPWVGRKFAMPKMRKYPHQIVLADQEGLLDAFPQKDKHVSLFKLDSDGKILEVQFWDPTEDELPFMK